MFGKTGVPVYRTAGTDGEQDMLHHGSFAAYPKGFPIFISSGYWNVDNREVRSHHTIMQCD